MYVNQKYMDHEGCMHYLLSSIVKSLQNHNKVASNRWGIHSLTRKAIEALHRLLKIPSMKAVRIGHVISVSTYPMSYMRQM